MGKDEWRRMIFRYACLVRAELESVQLEAAEENPSPWTMSERADQLVRVAEELRVGARVVPQ